MIHWSELQPLLELLPRDFSTGFLSGIAVGLFLKFAARYLALAGVFLLVLAAFREAGIL